MQRELIVPIGVFGIDQAEMLVKFGLYSMVVGSDINGVSARGAPEVVGHGLSEAGSMEIMGAWQGYGVSGSDCF